MTREEFDCLCVGDRVWHPFGGIGTVVRKDDRCYVVKDKGFDSGDGCDEVSFAWNEGSIPKAHQCRFSFIGTGMRRICVQKGWDDTSPTDEERCEKCKEFKSRYITFPLTINRITTRKIEYNCGVCCSVGQAVAVRPCGEEYGGKTYVGIYLGDLPMSIRHRLNEKTKVIEASVNTNPAIFVPGLKKIVFGYESWWREIKDENDFRDITSLDIDNAWYVHALKKISEEK